MKEHLELGFDLEPQSKLSIIEIGPGAIPSYAFLRKFKNSTITFVDDRPLKFHINDIPGSRYEQVGFLKYAETLEDSSIDVLLASNVIGAPYDNEFMDIDNLVKTSARIMKRGGLIVVENTYDGGKPSIGRMIRDAFEKSVNFQTTLYMASSDNKHRFLHQNEAHEGTFSLHIVKV